MHTNATIANELKVLIVGNNPIELSRVFQNLKQVEGQNLVTEIAFDFKSIRNRLINFRPDFVFIDDNIGKIELSNTMKILSKRKTKNILITILKNSNYQDSVLSGAINFLLKEALTPEVIYKSFIQSLRFKETNQLLTAAYRKRKRQFLQIIQA